MVWYSLSSYSKAASCNLSKQKDRCFSGQLIWHHNNNNTNTENHSHQPCCSSTAASLPCLPRLLLFPPPPLSPPPPPLSSFVLFRHFLILHFFLWMVSGQGLPPNCGSSLIMRVRMVCPLPQDLLHSDQSDHSETMQSTAGKAKIVHIVNICYMVLLSHTNKCIFQVQRTKNCLFCDQCKTNKQQILYPLCNLLASQAHLITSPFYYLLTLPLQVCDIWLYMLTGSEKRWRETHFITIEIKHE